MAMALHHWHRWLWLEAYFPELSKVVAHLHSLLLCWGWLLERTTLKNVSTGTTRSNVNLSSDSGTWWYVVVRGGARCINKKVRNMKNPVGSSSVCVHKK